MSTSTNTNVNVTTGDYFRANEDERGQMVAQALQTNATTLERDEYEDMVDRMISVYQERLNGIRDLRDAGLTRGVSLSSVVTTWQKRTDFTEADISMDGESSSDEDRVTYDVQQTHVPIIHKDFRIAQRELEASRNMGDDLRTGDIAEAARSVTEMAEAMLFQGWDQAVNTARGDTTKVYGYTSFPDRVTGSASGDWGTASNIRPTILDMIDNLDDNERTPGDSGYWLYLSKNQWQELRRAVDPDGDGNLNLRSRLEENFEDEIGAIRRTPEFALPDGELVMVDPSPDVVELAEAEDMQTVEWQSGSGMTNHYKTMLAFAPEFKSDSSGQSGIVHYTGA